ncbi:MAG TPA: hypothetical protein VH417_12040 [Vicinamibacterales bacterium]|jgi:hypothetical protein
MRRKRKPRYDLRDYWPWYERSWHVRGGHAIPPPFSLNDISNEPPPPAWQRRILQVLGIAVVVVVLGLLGWRLLQ